MIKVAVGNFATEKLHLFISHGFYNKIFVVRKEKETTTGPASLPRLKDIRTIQYRVKRLVYDGVMDSILVSQPAKVFNEKSFYLNLLI